MTASAWLDELLTLFSSQITGATFCRGWSGGPGSRAPDTPIVAGEVEAEVLKPGSRENKLRFTIFLPSQAGAAAGEALFLAMCDLAREQCPGFSAISRGSADRDKATGLLKVVCGFSLTESSGGGNSGSSTGPAALTVELGGRRFQSVSVKTGFSQKEEDLTAWGEEEAFRVNVGPEEYTVELEGIETAGLSRLTGFEATVGDTRYLSCRWKSLAPAKAVFCSRQREFL